MKQIEDYRNELDELIIKHDFDLSCEAVVKKSLEIEKILYSMNKSHIRN